MPPIHPLTAVSALSLLNQWSEARERRKQAERDGTADGTTNGSTKQPMTNEPAQNDAQHDEATQKLLEHQRRNEPPVEAVNAYVSRTITLNAGQPATVEITPPKGYNYRVSKIEFDRRDSHDYAFIVGGDTNAETHTLKFMTPRLVQHGQKVVAEVENNQSSGSTTFDFEFEAWAIPTNVEV